MLKEILVGLGKKIVSEISEIELKNILIDKSGSGILEFNRPKDYIFGRGALESQIKEFFNSRGYELHFNGGIRAEKEQQKYFIAISTKEDYTIRLVQAD